MYILNQSKTEIHNSDFAERFCISQKSDAALIVSAPGRDKAPDTLGRYKNFQEARDVLFDLFFALRSGEDSFEMPLSEQMSGEHHIRDARTKRKGGS